MKVNTKLKWITAALVVLAIVIGLGWRTLVIEYCTWNLSSPSRSGCVYFLWQDGHETAFLIRSGASAIPAIKRHIDSPDTGLRSKIHLAWILGKIGDHSRFSVFIEGLGSQRQPLRYIAAVRMRDFPPECLRHLPAIIEAGRQIQHVEYWHLLSSLVSDANLSEDKVDKLREIVDFENDLWNQKRGLTDQEIERILQLFGPCLINCD